MSGGGFLSYSKSSSRFQRVAVPESHAGSVSYVGTRLAISEKNCGIRPWKYVSLS